MMTLYLFINFRVMLSLSFLYKVLSPRLLLSVACAASFVYLMLYLYPELIYTRVITVPPIEYKGHKVILLWTPSYGNRLWVGNQEGNGSFLEAQCPQHRCVITTNKEEVGISHLVLFHLRDLFLFTTMPSYRNQDQRWIAAVMESPVHTYWLFLNKYRFAFNLTFTYQSDSDIYSPYGVPYRKMNRSNYKINTQIAEKKTKLILWYVSNCSPRKRNEYVDELKKYVDIDIFGKCGRADPCEHNYNCTLYTKKKYKFYLAFENSQCREYITEKFWRSFEAETVPIVLGAPLENITAVSPPHSFLHVDNFTSPKHLADFVKYLDRNDTAYNQFHSWRLNYGQSNVGLSILCRLCSIAHENVTTYKYYDMKKYWGAELNCH